METIFHHDPRIEDWVKQITEKIFTVCLLSGVDSEGEFQEGSLIVAKIATVFLGIATFPSEYLEDGIKQLLEQQLPDARVINNFPEFRETMNRMLQAGITKVMESRQIADKSMREEATEEAIKEVTEKITEELIEEVTENVTEEFGEKTAENEREKVIITKGSTEGELMVTLKHVLSFSFPNKKITWNSKLMGQTFLAQVEDTLICLEDTNQAFDLQTYIKEGWKVVHCTTDELNYPRRLERKIKQAQRLGKRS